LKTDLQISDETIKQFGAKLKKETSAWRKFISDVLYLISDIEYSSIQFEFIYLNKNNIVTTYEKQIKPTDHHESSIIQSKIDMAMRLVLVPNTVKDQLDILEESAEDIKTIYPSINTQKEKDRAFDLYLESDQLENMSVLSEKKRKKVSLIKKILGRKTSHIHRE
jgi:hypothetical protein